MSELPNLFSELNILGGIELKILQGVLISVQHLVFIYLFLFFFGGGIKIQWTILGGY